VNEMMHGKLVLLCITPSRLKYTVVWWWPHFYLRCRNCLFV